MRKMLAVVIAIVVLFNFGALTQMDLGFSSFDNQEVDASQEQPVLRSAKKNSAAETFALLLDESNAMTSAPGASFAATTVEEEVAVTKTESVTTAVDALDMKIEFIGSEGNEMLTQEEAGVTTAETVNALDIDNDGVLNADDKCPELNGVARFDGCPVPDSDADGVNDEDDRCPNDAGSVATNGCPVAEATAPVVVIAESEVKQIAKDNTSVRFNRLQLDVTGQMLSLEDFNLVLHYADELIDNREMRVEVIASGDNNGTYEKAAALKRAAIVEKYLLDLGVKAQQIELKADEQAVLTDKQIDLRLIK